ncbi:ATP-dependent dsDNA exonuclease [Streptococcus downei MFe28]|uniref:ATP-dependent dsDNA exonuclease n=1 Tax=Streptococcus downei MFe28 TaxID=764290 RepID=A0A380JAC3_STRDO|nr:ATP-dependent dsDNA exonuclease [Streptococcus downei MFe28]
MEAPYQELLQQVFYDKYPRKKARFAFDILVEERKDLEGINVRFQLEEIYGQEIIDLRIKETKAKPKMKRASFNSSQSQLAEDQLIADSFQR